MWPPRGLADEVIAMVRRDEEGVRWTSADRLHATLRFFGTVDEDDVDALSDALGPVARATARREAVIGPATVSFGRSILVAPIAGLDDLAAATVGASSAFGEPPDDRPFSGHLTLARSADRRRGRGGGRGGRGGRRGVDLRRFAGQRVAGSWLVDELTLVESRGGRYTVLARWPLLDAGTG